MKGEGEALSLRRPGAASTVLVVLLATALVFAAVRADPAAASLIPPRVWTGTVHGTSRGPVPPSFAWTANVRFAFHHYNRNHRAYVYGGTGSATYTASGSDLGCTYSGAQTFPIHIADAGMDVARTRTGWRYSIGVDATDEMTVHEDCGAEGGVRDIAVFMDKTLYMANRMPPVPRGLSSISGTYRDGGYTTHWDISGTPRHSDR
jgi:hypothetical protein